MENGDLHELNISDGTFTKTYFLNLGIQPSFCFDDEGFFFANFNTNMYVEFYKKDLSRIMIANAFDNNNNHLDLPVKSKTVHQLPVTPKLLASQKEKDNSSMDAGFRFNKAKSRVFDLKQSILPANKPLLSLKVIINFINLKF